MKKTSLNDIAKSLNVSKTLVSLVLNGHGNTKGINADTQKRVVEKARELNYKPNLLARGLRLGSSKTIGLIVADISNKFYSKIAKRIEEVAHRHGYNLIFCSSDEDPQKEIELIEMLRVRQVDGLIISTSQDNAHEFLRLKKENFPFVLIDRQLPKISAHYVGVDNYSGAFMATEHLINNGYKKIGFLRILPGHLKTINDRETGYRAALKKYNIRVNSKLIRDVNYNIVLDDVRKVLIELLQPPQSINAIFSSNNRIAVACLECLNEMNIRIPHDVALISFDDIDLFRFSYPTITSIAQPVENIGETAFNILLENINDNSNGNRKQIVLPVKLIERRSCGAFINHVRIRSKNEVFEN
ncbi:MAG: LacI family transcriptional regulator [Bacteroidetes bacterium 4572_114]|nr:MAG: LacI family transcriptional regulator [Bacteroidetes bacterium 4572_114]